MAEKRKGRTVDDLHRSLDAGKFAPVYLLTGEEDFLRHHARGLIRDAVVKRLGGTLAVFGGDEALERIFGELRGDSLFASKRVVEIISADEFVKSNADALVRYLERPSASGILVIDALKVDKRIRLYTLINTVGLAIECEPLKEWDVGRWVAGEVNRRGYRISPEASSMLVGEVGGNLFSLSNEIEKLLTYLGGRRKIEQADVAKVAGRSRVWEVWGLTDALGRRSAKECLAILENLLSEGTDAIGIVGTLNWQLRRLWEGKRILASGGNDFDLVRTLRVGKSFVGALREQIGKFSEQDLARLMHMLLETDVTLKSTGMSEKLVMERFLVRACAESAAKN
jgi:DNA polymerase-3 subunit delta